MNTARIVNFNPGPSAIPLSVLEAFSESIFNHKGSGMSIAEISHRSPQFGDIMATLEARIRSLFHLSDRYHVLFIQGGASLQFAMIPMNFLGESDEADYIHTGIWAGKAIHEAKLQQKNISVIASSGDRDFSYIPKSFEESKASRYLHLTSNNTIKGTQYHLYPESTSAPLVVDMSSDIFSRAVDFKSIGMAYASSQKNIGFSGVTLIIIRDDLLEYCPDTLPTMLNYRTYKEKNSLYNTPPCVSLYVMDLYLKWLAEKIGGVRKMAEINGMKAAALYQAIDSSDFYRGTVSTEDRSIMNITFRLPIESMETRFVADALAEGLGGLKGHRSVGGIRASLYNAITLKEVRSLVSFMEHFEKKNG